MKEKLFGFIITNRTGIISIHKIISNMPVTHVAIYCTLKSNLGSSNCKSKQMSPRWCMVCRTQGCLKSS